MKDLSFHFMWDMAGLVSVDWRDYAVHFGVRRSHWKWGHSVEPYEFCLDYWGAGPLVLFVRCNL